MTGMLDIFDTPVLPGLSSCEDLVSAAEERALVAAIDGTALSAFRFQGWEGKRLTASFGWTFDFDHGRLERGEPLPDWLLPVRDRAAAFAGLQPEELVHALLIRYDPGAGIGWHRDRPAFEHVVGLSLGSGTVMRFRRRRAERFERVTTPLVPRGAYHLTGEVRHEWEHSIAEMAQTRWSVTFRSLSERALGARA